MTTFSIKRRKPARPDAIPYLQLPATKWDALKFVAPFALAFAWAAITLWFNVQANAHDIIENKAAIVMFRDAKEDRGSRLSVVETQVKEIHDQQTEMARDIKQLLRDMPKGGK